MEEREKVREIYLLIHGVESRALGMEALRGAMYDDDYFPFGSCRVKLHKYGRFPVCLAVFKSFQDAYSDLLFYHILTLAGKYPNLQKINFIAHSWGTYLLERSVEKLVDENEYDVITGICLGKTILLGSVLPRNKMPYGLLIDIYSNKLINFVGANDGVVKTAGLFKHFGYGNSGAYGLVKDKAASLENVFTGWNHTDYAKDENIRNIIGWLKK